MIKPIDSQMVESVKQTTTAIQNDTLDNIALRFFGEQSGRFLPALIELNTKYSPMAILPMGSTITLPDLDKSTSMPTLKLWD